MLGALRSLHQNAHSSLPGTDGNQGKGILNSLENIGSRSLVYCCCFYLFSLSRFFFNYNKGPLFQSKKSHMLTFYYTIQSSLPLHLSTFPKLFVLKKKKKKVKKHNQSHFIWLGGWGVGRKTIFILPHLLKSIITFEIKLPSVQITTCAMLGCYFGLGLSSSQWKDSCSLSLQLRMCCSQLGSLPCLSVSC